MMIDGKDYSNKYIFIITYIYYWIVSLPYSYSSSSSPDGVMIDWLKKGERSLSKGSRLKNGKDQQPRGISHPSEDHILWYAKMQVKILKHATTLPPNTN